eukprot:31377-Pelagococcus_subviridis.AAC.5
MTFESVERSRHVDPVDHALTSIPRRSPPPPSPREGGATLPPPAPPPDTPRLPPPRRWPLRADMDAAADLSAVPREATSGWS